MGFRCAVSDDLNKMPSGIKKYNYPQRKADMAKLKERADQRQSRRPGGNVPDQELMQKIVAEKGVEGLQVGTSMFQSRSQMHS